MNNFNNSQVQQTTGYNNLDMIFNPSYNAQTGIPLVNKNFIMVTSLQEALSKQAPYNSKGIYLHQDGEYEFEICTDGNGRKTHEIFKRINCTNERDIITVSKNEYETLKDKIKKLEEVVYGKSTSNAANGDAKMQ